MYVISESVITVLLYGTVYINLETFCDQYKDCALHCNNAMMKYGVLGQ